MTRVVQCPKCEEQGSLQPKKTKHGTYWRVAHYVGLNGETRKIKWCYLGKELPEEITSQLITHHYPNITQTNHISEMPKSSFYNQTEQGTIRADSSVWNECLTCTQEAAGSNPARSTFKCSEIRFKSHFTALSWVQLWLVYSIWTLTTPALSFAWA
jgi:hypothetical protein